MDEQGAALSEPLTHSMPQRDRLGSLREQCAWGAAETHHMMFAMVPGMSGDPLEKSAAWRSYRLGVVYNPVYWGVWLPLLALIIVGRMLHFLAGQQGPLQEREDPIEHEVRVWWIYPSDAAFVGGLCLVAVNATLFAVEGTITDLYHWSELVISATIYVSYIISNFVFLHVMRQRSALHVKAFIAGNGSLALSLVVALIVLLVRACTGHTPASIAKESLGHTVLYIASVWALRVGFVLFLVLMAATYLRLWFLYDAEDVRLSRVLEQGDILPPPPPPPQDPPPPEWRHCEDGGYLREPDTTSSLGSIKGGTEPARPLRPRMLTARSHKRTLCYHYCSLLAAFLTSAVVAGLLVAASYLNNEALWAALAR